MKKLLLTLLSVSFILSCSTQKTTQPEKEAPINKVTIDLNNTKDDQVQVNITPPKIQEKQIVYHMPKIIPGTYSQSNYGKFIEKFTAYDLKGKELPVSKLGLNSWKIEKADQLSKITYWVNDTFDSEYTTNDKIFSPAGTNISKDNYVLNMHGFVGYFDGFKDYPYEVTISKSEYLYGATSLENSSTSSKIDVFKTARYHDIVDSPIMYTIPDTTTIKLDNMNVMVSVYSPSKVHTSRSVKTSLEKTLRAQKNFLGDFNSTKKYTILLYLSQVKEDAEGFGALEHATSTMVVMPDFMNANMLDEQLKDVVSHEFFHIVTPLSIQSEEISNFDYNNPKMSKHLWLYEGVTEYFANLFQVNQGLITEQEFFNRMEQKIQESKEFDEKIPFTKLSKNILESGYEENFVNFYQKGALIAMCLDIELREASNGKSGILDLLKELAKEYGSDKPFKDDELFDKIYSLTALTGSNVKNFIEKHIEGNETIDYFKYFDKMGVGPVKTNVTVHPFLYENTPTIAIDQDQNIIYIPEDAPMTVFYKKLGLKPKDIIKKVKGVPYTAENVYDLIEEAAKWDHNATISFVVIRDGKQVIIDDRLALEKVKADVLKFRDYKKRALKDAWLKGN